MKLILTTEVEKLGIAGDIVEVRDGYGRNYLLPQRMAIKWSKGAETQIEGIKRARDAREIRSNEHAEEIRNQLEALKVSMPVNVSESGKMFGSVTPADIAGAIKRAGGPTIDKRAVEIAKPIKTTGTHTVGVRLTPAVTAHIPLEVVSK